MNKNNRKIGITIACIMIYLISLPNKTYSKVDTTGAIFTKLLGCELEIDSITEMQEKFGKTKIYRDGDASESSTRINYFLNNEKCFVTFDAGEMGGGCIVTCFILRAVKNEEEFKTIPGIYFDKNDLGGLRIGMNQKDFEKVIGKNFKNDNNRIYKTFISKIPITLSDVDKPKKRNIIYEEYPFWDVIVNVMGVFTDSMLTQLNVCKVISN